MLFSVKECTDALWKSLPNSTEKRCCLFAIHNTSTKSAKKPKDRIIRPAFISCLSDLKLPLHAVKFAK